MNNEENELHTHYTVMIQRVIKPLLFSHFVLIEGSLEFIIIYTAETALKTCDTTN